MTPIFRIIKYFALLVLALSGCQTTFRNDASGDIAQTPPPVATIIYIIHGDDSYLYHTPAGKPLKADEMALKQALAVGKSLKKAEVFVYHQKPRKKFLFFFPKKDGRFYYFRNGRLIAEESYSRAENPGSFAAEGVLYRKFSPHPHAAKRMLFFFGHQIPEQPGTPYSKSYPNTPFSIWDFANNLPVFSHPSDTGKIFDLIALSTCNNGTPVVIDALAPLTNLLLASPGDLYLSYFDTQILSEVNLQHSSAETIAAEVARSSFARLQQNTQTQITVALYHIDKLLPQIKALATAQQKLARSVKTNSDCVDCRKILGNAASFSGIDVLHRPARFGRSKTNRTHSGLGCRQSEN
jgi:hypothetical protein